MVMETSQLPRYYQIISRRCSFFSHQLIAMSCFAVQKPKLLDTSSKKVKNKAISGVFLKKAVSEKEHNEKRHKHDLYEVSSEKRVSISEKVQSDKHSNLESKFS